MLIVCYSLYFFHQVFIFHEHFMYIAFIYSSHVLIHTNHNRRFIVNNLYVAMGPV